MTRTRRFVRGVGASYVNQIVVMVVGLWMTRFLLDTIGQYNYGLWQQIVQLVAALTLVDLGVSGLLPREIAYATGRAVGDDAPKEVAAVLGPVVRVVLWQSALVALAAVVIWLLIPATTAAAPLRLPLGLVLTTFVVAFPLRIFPGVLTGLQDLGFLGAVQLANWSLSTATTFTLAVSGFGLTSLAAGWAVSQIFPAIMAWRRLRRTFGATLHLTLPPISWALIRGLLGRSGWIAVGQVAQVLMASTDILIVGRILGTPWVVPYVCTEKLAALFEQQPQILLQGAQPGLAELRGGGSHERMLSAATALMTVVLVVSGGLLAVVLAVNHGFVVWWVKAPAWAGYTLTVLIVARVILSHWLITLGMIAFCMGYERRLAIAALVDGALTVVLSVTFARALGLIGVPLGAIIAHLLTSAPVYLFTLRREMGHLLRTMLRALWPWAWRFGLLAAAALFGGATWTPNSVPALAGVTIAVSIAYAIVMLPIVLRPPVGGYLHPGLHELLMRLPPALRGGAITPAEPGSRA
jgi:O-antigen/teichoic acid export membrane protein